MRISDWSSDVCSSDLNRLHWVLDVVFHDDLARLRTGNGPQNMAIVQHMALNLVRNPKDGHSLKVRRKLANINPAYLEKLIRHSAPLTLRYSHHRRARFGRVARRHRAVARYGARPA